VPVKTHKHQTKKYPKHYTRVYWPYLPLIIVMGLGLLLGNSFVNKSQRGVLSYATNVGGVALLEATNQQRLANTKTALTINQKLTDAAQAKANDMAKRDYWSHNTPDGKAPWVFVDTAGYQYQKAGENLAYGFANSQETVAGWMNSPSHKENVLDPTFREVGFGIANSENYQTSGPETIVVAMYGNPVSAVEPVTTSLIKKRATAVTSETPTTTEPQVKSINKAQALTNGHMPWIPFLVGLIGGSALVYLVLKNGLRVRRAIKKGERFVLHHPVIDITVVCLIVVCVLLSQSVGFIR
jgi:hypothetical protein